MRLHPITFSASHHVRTFGLRSGSSAPRLSSRGAWGLLQAVNASLHATSGQPAKAKLSSYVADILNLANVNLISALDDFGPSVRHWSPTVHEHVLDQGADLILAKYPLLALGAWLVTISPHGHTEYPQRCELYQSLKQVIAVLQSRSEAEMQSLQLGLSIAVYEVGHGMATQALQTLISCKAMLTLLEHGVNRCNKQTLETIEWLKASLLMLERYAPLRSRERVASHISNSILFVAIASTSLPLMVSPSNPICDTLASKYHPPIPPPLPGIPLTAPEKLHLRTVVALTSGHALDYVNALQRSLQPNESYDTIDTRVSACIKMLLDNPQPATWLHCDAIALGFCSNFLLQQVQVSHLERLSLSSQLHEHKERVYLALTHGRRMAWDMVRVALGQIESKKEVVRLPFAALCCVSRAGMAVLKTSGVSCEELASKEEVERLRRVVGWFGGRWDVGRQFDAPLTESTRETCFSL